MFADRRKETIDVAVRSFDEAFVQNYGTRSHPIRETLAWVARLALENIASSDALYHDLEHTVLVSCVGQEMLNGKRLRSGGVEPEDWLHFMVAVLCHDIGYVKGICTIDREGSYASGSGEDLIRLGTGTSDAALAPYHVDRGKRFVRERLGDHELIDAETVASWIELTRFPIPEGEAYTDTSGFPGLVRAADFIGQLGDPDYLRKAPALFYELEETGANASLGYKQPGDLRKSYAAFYWEQVYPLVQDGLRYLRGTQEGKQWIAHLHSHVFHSEHYEKLPGA